MRTTWSTLPLVGSCCLLALVSGDPSLLHEPAEDVYYGSHMPAGSSIPFVPPRARDISTEDFAKYAIAGRPIIITDAMKGWPMDEWTCDSIAKEFAGRKMRREYIDGPGSGVNNQDLSDKSWQTKQETNGETNADAPKFAPFYWDVKDSHERGEDDLLQKVQSLTKVPYFMRPENIGASVAC